MVAPGPIGFIAASRIGIIVGGSILFLGALITLLLILK